MNPLNLKDVIQYVEENIGDFHKKRIKRLDNLKLTDVLKRKNPYLFKAKYILTSEQIVKSIIRRKCAFCEKRIDITVYEEGIMEVDITVGNLNYLYGG